MIDTARSLAALAGGSRRLLLASAALAAVQAAILIPVGLVLKGAFDTAIPDGDVGMLVAYGAILLGLFLASAGLGLWTRWIVLGATKRAIAALRCALLERLQVLPASWFDAQPAGRVESIVVQDSERLDVMANAAAGQALPAAIVSAGLSVALLVVDPLLFCLLAITWPAMLFAGRRLRPRLRRRTRQWQNAFDRFTARIHFAVRGRTLISSHGAERPEREAGGAEIEELSARGREMAWLQSLYGQVNGALGAFSAVLVLVIGGAAVANDNSSLGALVSFYALLGLLRAQVSMLLSAIPQLISGGESLMRVQQVLEAPDQPVYMGARRIEYAGGIELCGVRFGYGGVPVLERAEITAEAGEWVGLCGANGAGKSTIASLVLGLYRPWQGELRADGISYDELDLIELRRCMAVVTQDPIMLAGTVAENVSFGRPPEAGDETVEAFRLAGCAALLETLADGPTTRVGDEGELLSGGQRQAVALARAVIRRPALLILDEPSTSLDRVALPLVLEALRSLPWGPTVLLISHEPVVIGHADRVYELRAGVSSEVIAPARMGPVRV